MSQPIDHPKERELSERLAAELKAGLAGPASPRPVDPVAGAGAGAWGPTSPTPNGTLADQIATMDADAQRLIEMLQNMRDALVIIRRKLG